MSITPPDAPPYPTTPEDERPDDETSAAAYAEILVRFIDENYSIENLIFLFF